MRKEKLYKTHEIQPLSCSVINKRRRTKKLRCGNSFFLKSKITFWLYKTWILRTSWKSSNDLSKHGPKSLLPSQLIYVYSFTQRNSDTMRFGTKMLRDKQQSKGLKRKPKPMINRPSKKVKLEDVKMEIETIAVKEETWSWLNSAFS